MTYPPRFSGPWRRSFGTDFGTGDWRCRSIGPTSLIRMGTFRTQSIWNAPTTNKQRNAPRNFYLTAMPNFGRRIGSWRYTHRERDHFRRLLITKPLDRENDGDRACGRFVRSGLLELPRNKRGPAIFDGRQVGEESLSISRRPSNRPYRPFHRTLMCSDGHRSQKMPLFRSIRRRLSRFQQPRWHKAAFC
jgi:hypothetical protein